MTIFTAPPDQNGLNLGFGDILNIDEGGEATGTTIRTFGVENVNDGGTSIDTTIKRGGVEHVFKGGEANGTILDGGNQEVHSGGVANGTIIDDGREFVDAAARQITQRSIDTVTSMSRAGPTTQRSTVAN